MSSSADVIRLAIGLNRVRAVVDDQKKRRQSRAPLSEDNNSDNNNNNRSGNRREVIGDQFPVESRVFYDLPLGIRVEGSGDESPRRETAGDGVNKVDKPVETHRQQRRREQEVESVAFRRKTTATSASKPMADDEHKDGERIPRWVSPINIFVEDLLRERRPQPPAVRTKSTTASRPETRRVLRIGANKENTKQRPMRSMSNLPVDRLERLLLEQKARENQTPVICRRRLERHYDAEQIRYWIHKRRAERRARADSSKQSTAGADTGQRSRHYNPVEVREFMAKQQQKRATKSCATARTTTTTTAEPQQSPKIMAKPNHKITANSVVTEKQTQAQQSRPSPVKNSSVAKPTTTTTTPVSQPLSPSKGVGRHRRQTPISMNAEQLKEMLTKLITENSDNQNASTEADCSLIAEARPPVIVEVPTYNLTISDAAVSQTSAVSLLTNSVATNETLSPLTGSPDSSFRGRSPSGDSDELELRLQSEQAIDRSVRAMIDRAVNEIPSWDELCERVYNTKLRSRTSAKNLTVEPSADSRPSITPPALSPKSAKAMEVFPRTVRSSTPIESSLSADQMPKFIEQQLHHYQISPPSLSAESLSSSKSAIAGASMTPPVEKLRTDSPSAVYTTSFETASPTSCSISLSLETSAREPSPPSSVSSPLSVRERVDQIRRQSKLIGDIDLDAVEQQLSASGKLSPKDILRLTVTDIDDQIAIDIDDDRTDNVSSITSESAAVSESSAPPEPIAGIDIESHVRAEAVNIFKAEPRTAETIANLCSDGRPRKTGRSRHHFEQMLVELCRDLTLERMCFAESEPPLTLELPLRLQRRRWPRSDTEFADLLVVWTKRLLERPAIRPNIGRDGLMGYCRMSHRRDLVDTVLHEELRLEDARWSYFEPEIATVRAEQVGERLSAPVFGLIGESDERKVIDA